MSQTAWTDTIIKMRETNFFNNISGFQFAPDTVLDLTTGNKKAFIVSDLHMGTGRRDDMAANGELLASLLEHYYFKRGWHLVLNGDVEELQRFPLESIMERWERLYMIFNLFEREKRLYKLIGNHDEELLLKKNYPYPLYDVIRIDTNAMPAYVFHGHQSSSLFSKYNKLLGAGVRYVLKPFGIKNISSARSPYRRYFVEKKAYHFSLANRCISIIGHTHRPLFESLGRFDFIKFEIERLCRDYPKAPEAERRRMETEVTALRHDLGKLKRKERRDVLRQSLYGDDLPVPCLFNAGCAIGKQGLHAIELSGDDIALVYWYAEDQGRKFIKRGGYDIEPLEGTAYRRAILNRDSLNYVKARIRLLGAAIE